MIGGRTVKRVRSSSALICGQIRRTWSKQMGRRKTSSIVFAVVVVVVQKRDICGEKQAQQYAPRARSIFDSSDIG